MVDLYGVLCHLRGSGKPVKPIKNLFFRFILSINGTFIAVLKLFFGFPLPWG